jgi:hypothetical protein
MAAPQPLVKAVEVAIVASAHLAAYEHLSAATHAVRRLGQLSTGRWRSVARDLERLEDDLQTAFSESARELTTHAEKLGVEEEALWSAGDAAATLDLLRDSALEEVDEDSPEARLLTGRQLFGVAFVENPELPDRGTTLLFGWAEPLVPATWPWQASWIVEDGEEDGMEEELDLYPAGEVEISEALLDSVASELGTGQVAAQETLQAVAVALTRASLLAAVVSEDQEEEDS